MDDYLITGGTENNFRILCHTDQNFVNNKICKQSLRTFMKLQHSCRKPCNHVSVNKLALLTIIGEFDSYSVHYKPLFYAKHINNCNNAAFVEK